MNQELAQALEDLNNRLEALRDTVSEIDREYDRQIEYLKKRVEELERHVKV